MSTDRNTAISVSDVSKMYKLYERNRDRLYDALGFSKRARFKEHYALKALSFDIEKGETVGIIGTNGAGKSTILKIITGVLSPTEGSVTINGRVSALLELGAGFNDEYSGLENIYLNGAMIGFTKEEIDERLDDILAFADIGDYIHQPVKSYSSGMFVRLAFAVAINIDPEILIVDEALSVGDVFFQAKCYKKFEDFKKEGKTILFVSHDLSSIARYCDRVILLDKGHMLASGEPKEMIDLYKKVLVGQTGAGVGGISGGADSADGDGADAQGALGGTPLWRDNFKINPELNEYGDGRASIIDFGIFDENGLPTVSVEKGTSFTIRSKVRFFERIDSPIFTFTLKNIQGVAITGTNSMYEKQDIGRVEAGDVYVASFTQDMWLQGGEYLLSISCTGYRDGEFVVYHRLYDVLSVTVISARDTVGFYDCNTSLTIERVASDG